MREQISLYRQLRPSSVKFSFTGCAALLAACTGGPAQAPEPAAELRFVRGGVVVPDGSTGQPLTDGRRLVLRDWTAGEEVALDGAQGTAPRQAECVPLYSQDLGDVSRLVAGGGAAPNTALAFSPDGALLAVGSYTGEVMLLDGWTGAVRARRRLAETMVKAVTWSEDGQTLYAAEQSPDAYIHALDAADLSSRWSLRLADIVGTSAPPPADDVYGIYTLPGAYGLLRLPGGDIVTAALHSWLDGDGVRLNRSQVLRIRPDGTVAARWPAEPADATFKHPRTDEAGQLILVSVNRSADGPPPPDLPIGGVAVLKAADLSLQVAATPPPLAPWFDTAFVWEAMDISPEQGIFLGLGDGRVQTYRLDGTPQLQATTGAPIMAGDVPIHASVGFGFFYGDGLVYSTSKTLIPYGAASSALRPPTAHPNENTLWHTDADGSVRWSWSGAQLIEGLSLSDDQEHLVVGAGDRQTDSRRDLYGALIFDLRDAEGERSGEDRLEAFCPTQGPVFFRQAMSTDGRVALAEHPYLDGDGIVQGRYQVTVMR